MLGVVGAVYLGVVGAALLNDEEPWVSDATIFTIIHFFTAPSDGLAPGWCYDCVVFTRAQRNRRSRALDR